MNNQEVATLDSGIMSSLVINGDLSKLSPDQKMQYYRAFCDRLGLDPITQPFKLLRLNGKEILYADKGATQQLSKVHNISHEVTRKESVGDVYVVTVRAKMGDRFTDEDGAVTIAGLKGDALANALMKAVTKAKRRAVLALVGLGMMDETEIETVKGAIPLPAPLPPSTGDAMPPAVPDAFGGAFDHPKPTDPEWKHGEQRTIVLIEQINAATTMQALKGIAGEAKLAQEAGDITESQYDEISKHGNSKAAYPKGKK